MKLPIAILVLCAVLSASSGGKIYMHLTSANRAYKFFPVETDYIEFQVKTTSDINIALSPGPYIEEDYNRYYQIVIGGWSNTKSAIRKGRDDNIVASHLGSIAQNVFVTYWIQKNDTERSIYVGKGKGSAPLLSFVDPDYVKTMYFGASTCCGAQAFWIFDTKFLNCKSKN